jgi:hypothetical protein
LSPGGVFNSLEAALIMTSRDRRSTYTQFVSSICEYRMNLLFKRKIELRRLYESTIRPEFFYAHGPTKTRKELAFWSGPQGHKFPKGSHPHHGYKRLDLTRLG